MQAMQDPSHHLHRDWPQSQLVLSDFGGSAPPWACLTISISSFSMIYSIPVNQSIRNKNARFAGQRNRAAFI